MAIKAYYSETRNKWQVPYRGGLYTVTHVTVHGKNAFDVWAVCEAVTGEGADKDIKRILIRTFKAREKERG